MVGGIGRRGGHNLSAKSPACCSTSSEFNSEDHRKKTEVDTEIVCRLSAYRRAATNPEEEIDLLSYSV